MRRPPAACPCSSPGARGASRRWSPTPRGPPGRGSIRGTAGTWPTAWPGWPACPRPNAWRWADARPRSSPTGGPIASPAAPSMRWSGRSPRRGRGGVARYPPLDRSRRGDLMDHTRSTVAARSERGRRARPARRPREGWIHLCNGLDPVRDGGMVPSILGMTGALAERGDPVMIVTPTPSRLGDTVLPPRLTLRGPETDLEAVVRGAEVVHLHGLWQGHTRRGARAARGARVPYLITAHGMAEPWALRHKYWKKKLYTALVEGKNLRHASGLHALSRPEIAHLRALAPRTPICFIPNGVDLRPFERLPGPPL